MACGHAKMGLPNLGVVKPKAPPLSLRELGRIAGKGGLSTSKTNQYGLPSYDVIVPNEDKIEVPIFLYVV